MKKIVFAILTMVIIYANLSIVSACTVFNATRDGITMVGSNEDGLDKDTDKGAKVWFLPAEYRKFGRVFFGFNVAGPESGMNEKGLFFDWVASEELMLAGKLAPESLEKMNYKGSLGEKILEECSTVNQALGMYKKYNEPTFGYAVIMLTDSQGESALVTWDWEKNELSVTKKNESFHAFGHGKLIVSRELANDSEISEERLRKLLDYSHQKDLTIYSNVYDLNKKEVYVYYHHNFNNSVKFNLDDELKKGKHLYNLYGLFPRQKFKMPMKEYFFKEFSEQEKNFLIVRILAFLVPIFACPVYYLIRRRRSKGSRTMNMEGKALHISWIVTVLNSILGLMILYLIIRYANFLAKYGYEIIGREFTHLPLYMVLLTAGQIIALVFAWKHRFWSLKLKLFFSLSAINAVYFIIYLILWNLLLV